MASPERLCLLVHLGSGDADLLTTTDTVDPMVPQTPSGAQAISRGDYRPARSACRRTAGNGVRRRLHHPGIRRTTARRRRYVAGAASAADTFDRRLSEWVGRRRARGSD